jgi:hypothetical protein
LALFTNQLGWWLAWYARGAREARKREERRRELTLGDPVSVFDGKFVGEVGEITFTASIVAPDTATIKLLSTMHKLVIEGPDESERGET